MIPRALAVLRLMIRLSFIGPFHRQVGRLRPFQDLVPHVFLMPPLDVFYATSDKHTAHPARALASKKAFTLRVALYSSSGTFTF